MRLILLGMPRVGKTSVGKLCSEKLGANFFDTDELLAKRFSLSAAELFAKKGEAEFRRLEFLILRDFLKNTDNFVLATGGGIVEFDDSVALLAAEKTTAYLTAPLAVIAERIMQQRIAGKPFPRFFRCEECSAAGVLPCKSCIEKKLYDLFLRRDAWYRSIASFIVENAGNLNAAAEEVIGRINGKTLGLDFSVSSE